MIDGIDRAPLLALVSCALLVASTGCGDLPYDPVDGPLEKGLPPAEPVEDSFPSVPQSAIAYDRESPHASGALSRYVLDTISGEFELQYLGAGGLGVFTGTYTRFAWQIDFDFDGWSAAGPWEATGTLGSERLDVSYNVVMLLSDFENGTYVRR